jgi:hypothetical protein
MNEIKKLEWEGSEKVFKYNYKVIFFPVGGAALFALPFVFLSK